MMPLLGTFRACRRWWTTARAAAAEVSTACASPCQPLLPPAAALGAHAAPWASTALRLGQSVRAISRASIGKPCAALHGSARLDALCQRASICREGRAKHVQPSRIPPGTPTQFASPPPHLPPTLALMPCLPPTCLPTCVQTHNALGRCNVSRLAASRRWCRLRRHPGSASAAPCSPSGTWASAWTPSASRRRPPLRRPRPHQACCASPWTPHAARWQRSAAPAPPGAPAATRCTAEGSEAPPAAAAAAPRLS